MENVIKIQIAIQKQDCVTVNKIGKVPIVIKKNVLVIVTKEAFAIMVLVYVIKDGQDWNVIDH